MSEDPVLAQRDGWWWPADDVDGRAAIVAECAGAVKRLLELVPGRTCIVQAGGNVGVYPLALADHFRRVITAEPDPVNVRCLWKNLALRDGFARVDARNAAFGAADGGVCETVEVSPRNCGAHRIRPLEAGEGEGRTPILTIDGLGLLACDAIWLDIEGYELAALRGAEETVARFAPVVAVEDKGLGAAFGFDGAALAAWFAARGYRQVARIGNDKVFRKGEP